MSYDEFKGLCREAWKEKYNYLKIIKTKKGIVSVRNLVVNNRCSHHKQIIFRGKKFEKF